MMYVSQKQALVALLAMLGTGMVWAQSTGTFAATGNMTLARYGHSATLLRDGRALIAGGVGFDFQGLASAELYDPSTGTFTATGDMTTPRWWSHTATLLPDGKVLIVGGALGPPHPGVPVVRRDGSLYTPMVSDPLPIAELYDPATGTFSATGSTLTPHQWHAATLLPNGNVLIFGGTIDRVPQAAGELYDPATGTFAATGEMAMAQVVPSATLLPSGEVLLVDGGGQLSPPSAQLYDPATRTTSATGYSNVFRGRPTATLLPSGKILVAGGDPYGDWALNSAELYDPATGSFFATETMTHGYEDHTATLLPDGTVLIAGGHEGRWAPDGFYNNDDRGDLFDPVTGRFRATGDMAAGRELHTATLLKNGQVLIAGGVQYWAVGAGGRVPEIGLLSSAEIYNSPPLAAAPLLLSVSGAGQGQGAIQHAATYEIASSGNPAVEGETLVIYCAGLIEGIAIPPEVTIGGHSSEVLFFGKPPWLGGLNQVNVRVPGGVVPGPAVPVRLTYFGLASNEVTIGVR